MKKKQKEIFLEQEGNAWFDRNHLAIQNREMGSQDPIINILSNLLNKKKNMENQQLLEIGCGEGKRLHWISENYKLNCYGIDPSEKAIALANKNGVKAIKGTADILNFENKKFDFVVFGFCLYLCDRSDLFLIAKEADRVLKDSGFIIIHDFFSETPIEKKYHHYPGMFSYKMDYRKLFDWHPFYKCISHEIMSEEENKIKDDKDKLRATSVLSKQSFYE